MSTRPERRDVAVRIGWTLVDALIVSLSVLAAAWIRFDMDARIATAPDILSYSSAAGLLQFFAGLTLGLVHHPHRRGSFEETAQVARTTLIVGVALVGLRFFTDWFSIPRSLPFIVPVIALVGMFALRFIVRSYRWGRRDIGDTDTAVVVYGAGEGGRQLLRALTRDASPNGRLVPVALLDDDPRKRRMLIEGHRVSGGADRLADVIERTDATTLAVAMPSLSADRLREIRTLARIHGLDLLVLPPVGRLLGPASGADLRQLNLEDLLGRQQITMDAATISDTITGKRVLVTGAGGSIGSELVRQIAKFSPAKLVLLDRDESALHATQMSLTGRALLDDGTLALCDIRDSAALQRVFEAERPEVVFHAAALKHLTLLEQFPLEAWQSNVLGTANVLTAAEAVGVEKFVNISTDKAASPTCVLGYSKRLAERLTAEFAEHHRGTYVSVRFGNVLGSRGSVITAFTAQIERGGPVTVTHPDVERYFMLIPEASQLVLQASAIGANGDVMVLDMGEPVKILDVANTLIDLSEKPDIEVVFTGMRPGEKLSEELFANGETITSAGHALINRVAVPRISLQEIADAGIEQPEPAREWMLEKATTGRVLT
ncbi:probable dtdp-glucose 4,6-dehydratase transmembrane protein [Janibacter sp. HTCC2649]|uniref:polysaccharide biosynthesis protein n=1 Tax=Janibacter sp. HTCC2649 TaxID=313589 RepID=UPI000067101E|nr:nucleoside-diphosphate sugar epimerase/dehydratase [Janibacter sp. HTCC2649]EAP97400.1 probable dtdp-glucose 4,6-dehydratase transmembrane protein [Janibacter sp. HTCC2649]